MDIRGVYTAMVTPFRGKEVDYDGLRQNIAFQIENGISGILVLGTTGENPTLSRKEQDTIIKVAAEETKGKAILMVGTGTNSTEKTIENTGTAKELGADIALIVTPYYNKPTNEGLYRHFKAVSEAVDIPVVVYNIQGRTGKNIDTATMKRIAQLKNIAGVKEASGNIDQIGEVLGEIASKNPEFSVMSGDDSMTFPLMALGGKGIISVVSNLVPKKVVEMANAAERGDFNEARKLHFELLPIFKGAFIETNPIPIKEAMDMAGMPSGPCRLPLCEMEPQNREKLKKILEQMKII
ncbi:MAG: 4-hydroxy-tetrahydrodipicolinate synthase [archaeon]